jgi:hypothetical protein
MAAGPPCSAGAADGLHTPLNRIPAARSRAPNPRRRPYKKPPQPASPCTAPPPWGFPLNPPPPPKSEGERRRGGRKEAQEAGEKPGAAVVRGLRRRAGATVSPFVKKKTGREGGEGACTAAPSACAAEGRRRRPSRSRSGREPRRAEPLLFGCAPRRHQPAAAPKAGEPSSLA